LVAGVLTLIEGVLALGVVLTLALAFAGSLALVDGVLALVDGVLALVIVRVSALGELALARMLALPLAMAIAGALILVDGVPALVVGIFSLANGLLDRAFTFGAPLALVASVLVDGLSGLTLLAGALALKVANGLALVASALALVEGALGLEEVPAPLASGVALVGVFAFAAVLAPDSELERGAVGSTAAGFREAAG